MNKNVAKQDDYILLSDVLMFKYVKNELFIDIDNFALGLLLHGGQYLDAFGQ